MLKIDIINRDVFLTDKFKSSLLLNILAEQLWTGQTADGRAAFMQPI